MSSDKDQSDDKKKPGEGEGTPPAEAILAERQRDPDEAVFAEQAIRSFVATRLGEWYEQVESSIDSLEAWLSAHDEATRATFAQRGFFDALGDRYIGDLFALAGGRGHPIMDALAGETYSTVSWAGSAEADVSGFLNHMRRGVRDACWFVRDSLPSLVSQDWPELLDLAYEGSTDFIPRLHALGLPPFNFKPAAFADGLIAYSDAYQKALAPMKEQAADEIADPGQKRAAEEEAQRLALDDGAKKQSQTVGA